MHMDAMYLNIHTHRHIPHEPILQSIESERGEEKRAERTEKVHIIRAFKRCI